MIAGGIGTLLTAVVAHLTIMSSPDAYETSVNLLQRALLTVAVSLGSIIAHNLLVVANQVIAKFTSHKNLNLKVTTFFRMLRRR